jgi:hypothetical protein
VVTICLSCGDEDEKHDGGPGIRWKDLKAAAEAADITPVRAAENILSSALHAIEHGAKAVNSEPAVTGQVLKADETNRFVLMVAYSANKMPHRGADKFVDVATPHVLEKACWRFMDHGARVGLWHEDGHEDCARVVENSVYRNPKPWVIKCPNGQTETIREGDWIVGMILDEPTWAMYKAGLIGGASPQGECRRSPASPETLARMR